ncbi:hypothetical protein JXA12_01165 [Candidatus Woesearchaeota archaeon]|nr:hypothetical protein [Candidatus Woesearchaeota archaeon]
MVFDDLIDGIIPKHVLAKKTENIDSSIDDLYLKLYRLQVAKEDLKKAHDLHDGVTYAVLENVMNKLTDHEELTASQQVPAKKTSMEKVRESKQALTKEVAGKVHDLDQEMKATRKEIEAHAKERLYADDFSFKVIMRMDHDLKYGTIETAPMAITHRLPLFYLFNKTVPAFNLEDTDLETTLFSALPESTQAFLNDQKGGRHSNFYHSFKNYKIKYFNEYVDNDYSIPLFLLEEKGAFETTYGRFNRKMRQFRLNPWQNNVFYDLNHCSEEGKGYESVREHQHSIQGCLLGNYTSWRKEGRMEKDLLVEAMGKIVATFYEANVADKVQVEERLKEIRQ